MFSGGFNGKTTYYVFRRAHGFMILFMGNIRRTVSCTVFTYGLSVFQNFLLFHY